MVDAGLQCRFPVQTDETAPDFDRVKYEDARRRVGAALHGVQWVFVPPVEGPSSRS
jgi:hypothetical protein